MVGIPCRETNADSLELTLETSEALAWGTVRVNSPHCVLCH